MASHGFLFGLKKIAGDGMKRIAELAVWISPGQNHARQIANTHVLFNVGGVLLFAWFTRPIARLLERIIPDKVRRTARAATG
jgi:phosphate:Na+ symporter